MMRQDQASINTNESYDEHGNVLDDYNPTTINGLIRELLGIFECRSYIGYTALRPFANIFIPPHIDDEKYGTDLFPRDLFTDLQGQISMLVQESSLD